MIRLTQRVLALVRAACGTAESPFKRVASVGLLSTFLWIGALSLVASACAPDRPLAPLTEKPVEFVSLAASLAAYPQVSAGGEFTCAVKRDEALACWGDNSYGQATPPPGSVTQLSTGYRHSCAVKADGTLACWGREVGAHIDFGQATPPAGSFTQVSAGLRYTCAVKTDGTLLCWGNNDRFQATPPSTGTFTQVSAGGWHTCALKTDGTLACWGWNYYGLLALPAGTFSQVSVGNLHTCALKTDQTLTCWGYNAYGQTSPPPGIFTQVSSGVYHTCAVKTDQTLACWGYNGMGQATPPTGAFTQVSAGGYHTCAVRTNGTLACWGHNYFGQASPPSWNQPPVANAGPDLTAEASGPAGATVALNGAGSSDADNDLLTYTWTGPFGTASGVNATVTLPLGTHTVTLTVSDGQATSTDDVQITIHDTTAPETGINSASDGNGTSLSGGASTLSSAVTIVFGGSDAVGVTGFECSMDAIPYSLCTSPVTYTALVVGNHVFRVRALDAAGNLDFSPASITWAVITPSMAIDNLIKLINNMGLPAGTANSLAAPLGEISKLLNDGNPNNDGAVCNKLDAFLTQVGVKEGNGQLTAAQASQLRIAATAIKRSLGC